MNRKYTKFSQNHNIKIIYMNHLIKQQIKLIQTNKKNKKQKKKIFLINKNQRLMINKVLLPKYLLKTINI